ncbi:hypothetical protein [Glaciihabitans sp. dw_435]|uniref:hypothetical protein n=1 Tax=Glaciihabitans sp. dw_435 TaxID=2720081 RepID=UPI001BD2EEF3|nr:hypothetical protein [Glaciihabitans sp. dw_435]
MMDDPGASAPGGRDLNDLRRIAFGRTESPADERAAADARRQLDELERAGQPPAPSDEQPRADVASASPGPNLPGASDATLTGDGEPEGVVSDVLVVAGDRPTAHRAPWGRGRWLVVVAAAFLIGAVASATFAATRPTTVRFVPTNSDGSGVDNRVQPSATGAPFTVSTPEPLDANGDGFVDGRVGSYTDDYTGTIAASSLRASEKWFSAPQTANDRTTIRYTGLVPNSTRLMHSDTAGLRYWIARNNANDFCLLTAMPGPGNTSMACTTVADFIVSGLTTDTVDAATGESLGSVSWTARAFTLSSTSAEKSLSTGGGKTTATG